MDEHGRVARTDGRRCPGRPRSFVAPVQPPPGDQRHGLEHQSSFPSNPAAVGGKRGPDKNELMTYDDKSPTVPTLYVGRTLDLPPLTAQAAFDAHRQSLTCGSAQETWALETGSGELRIFGSGFTSRSGPAPSDGPTHNSAPGEDVGPSPSKWRSRSCRGRMTAPTSASVPAIAGCPWPIACAGDGSRDRRRGGRGACVRTRTPSRGLAVRHSCPSQAKKMQPVSTDPAARRRRDSTFMSRAPGDQVRRGYTAPQAGDAGICAKSRPWPTYTRLGATWWRDRLSRWQPPRPAASSTLRLSPTGDGFWLVGTQSQSVPVKALKGYSYLRELLRQPGLPVAAIELVTAGPAPSSSLDSVRSSTRRPFSLPAATEGSRRRHRRSRRLVRYRPPRITGNRADAAGGRTHGRRRSWGKSEPVGSSRERARVAATKALTTAIDRITGVDELIGRHLQRTIHTGSSCAYRPDGDRPVEWILD